MHHAGVTRPPRLRNLDEMRMRSSMFDSSSQRSGLDTEVSMERRAKVKMPIHRMTNDNSSLNTAKSSPQAKVNKLPSSQRPRASHQVEPGSIISNWSKSSLVKPLFEFDSGSILSAESTETLFQNDDPWRAAKRGDLTTLKQFHTSGKVDWLAKDEFRNIPLYYACHSGAIADVMVVPFLLWVTPLTNEKIVDKCIKNAVNQQVRSILKAFRKGGLSAIAMEKSTPSVDSRQSSKKEKVPTKVRESRRVASSCCRLMLFGS